MPQENREGKLGPRWTGPFRVDRVLITTTYLVGNKKEHVFNMKKAKFVDGPSDQTVIADVVEAQKIKGSQFDGIWMDKLKPLTLRTAPKRRSHG